MQEGDKVRLNPNIKESSHCNNLIEDIIREYNLIGEIVKNREDKVEVGFDVDFFSNNKEIFNREWEEMIRQGIIFNSYKRTLKGITRNYYVKGGELKPAKNKVKKL